MIDYCCNILSAALDGRYGWLNEVLTILGVMLVFNLFARWLLKKLHKRFEGQKKIWKDSFVQALYAPLITYTWFFAFVHSSNIILPKLVSKDYYENMHMLLGMAAVITISWFILRWKKNLLRLMSAKIKRHQLPFEQAKLDVINKLITVFVIFLTIMFILEITDRSMSTLIAFGGVGGLAIAFASQEMIANYFSGLMVYFTRPFVVGDWIHLPEKNIEGWVEDIGWYMTRVRTFEKRPIYVPNAIFSKIVVVTPSRMSHREFKEVIGLRYSDLPVIKAVIFDLEAMLEEHPDVDQEQKVQVYLKDLGTYSLDLEVKAYTTITTSEEYAYFKQDLFFKILDVLKAQGAELATPLTTVNIPEGINLIK